MSYNLILTFQTYFSQYNLFCFLSAWNCCQANYYTFHFYTIVITCCIVVSFVSFLSFFVQLKNIETKVLVFIICILLRPQNDLHLEYLSFTFANILLPTIYIVCVFIFWLVGFNLFSKRFPISWKKAVIPFILFHFNAFYCVHTSLIL